MDAQQKCECILEWAEKNAKFDTGFVMSVMSSIDKYGSATSRQEEALDRIIEKFHIDPEEYGYVP